MPEQLPQQQVGTWRRRRGAALLVAVAAFFLPLSPTGFNSPATYAAECEGDECQGPAPAPEDPVPGTAVVEGPGNPPVRFAAAKQKKQQRHKHHRQGGGRR